MRSPVAHSRPCDGRIRLLHPAAIAALLFLGACAIAGPEGGAPSGVPGPLPQEQGASEVPVPAETPEGALEEVAADAPAEEPEAQAEDGEQEAGETSEGISVHGYVTARTRSRWTDDAEDHDLYTVAAVDVATPGPDPWRIHLMARGSWDMDGQPSDADDLIFKDIEDTYGDRLNGRLYYAYVDAPLRQLDLARLGRQIIEETPVSTQFDGLHLRSNRWGPAGMGLGLYGGVPVHLYESSSSGDALIGAYAFFRPWEQGEMRFDYMHLEDETRLGPHDDDLLSVGLQHAFHQNLRVKGGYTNLEGRNRDVSASGQWVVPERGFTFRVSHYQLLEAQKDLANELNPFYNSLRTLYPYGQTQLTASKTFGEWLDLLAGLDFRRVDDDQDIGRFNRDFDRYFLTASLLEILPLATTLSLTGETWDSPGSDIRTWGIDLDSRINERWRTAVGSFYSLYKYDLLSDSEREDVRTYYAEVRRRWPNATELKCRYEFEDEDFEEYNSVWVTLTWRF